MSARSADELAITLGRQDVPGWQPVTVSRGTQSSTLPRGIGVEPMLDLELPFARDGSRPNELVYHGETGDLVVWLLAGAKGPRLFGLPGYGHGFGLDLSTLVVLTSTPVGSPDGRLAFPLPAVRIKPALYVQGLVLAPAAPYRPGAFTNVLLL